MSRIAIKGLFGVSLNPFPLLNVTAGCEKRYQVDPPTEVAPPPAAADRAVARHPHERKVYRNYRGQTGVPRAENNIILRLI
jgi:hypothetical protein